MFDHKKLWYCGHSIVAFTNGNQDSSAGFIHQGLNRKMLRNRSRPGHCSEQSGRRGLFTETYGKLAVTS